MCILSALLKVVGYYDECSVHVSDRFPKKKFGWVGELHPSLFWIFGFLLTFQSP